jgi:hypothetical protein
MHYKDKIISAYAERACTDISKKVIKDLRKMTEGIQSGDDSPLKNIWDEVCVQMQGEQSLMWEAYEDIINRLIQAYLNPWIKKFWRPSGCKLIMGKAGTGTIRRLKTKMKADSMKNVNSTLLKLNL